MADEILIADKVAFTQNKNELLRNCYRKINELVYIINTKDTAIFSENEFFTSQQWYFNKAPGKQQMIYRIVIYTGALANIGTTIIPHNIALTDEYDFIKIWGDAKDLITPQWITMGHPDITVLVTAVNIEITTTSNLSAYTESKVVLEYITP